MEQMIIDQIIKAAANGDLKGVAGWGLVFSMIWFQLRGLRSELKKLNDHITEALAKGETRFQSIESRLSQIEKRTDHTIGNQGVMV